MFCCPSCKEILNNSSTTSNLLVCSNVKCQIYKRQFTRIDNIPILVPFGFDDCIFDNLDFNLSVTNKNKHSKKFEGRSSFLSYVSKIFMGESKITKKNFKYLSSKINNNSRILIIGGAEIGYGMHNFYLKCINEASLVESIDVYPSSNITVIADAHYLPYKNNSFDLVIIQAVLEHVINPNRVISEVNRVLVDKGLVYAETPFMQSVHEGPFDFTRYTHSGHRWLFKDFRELSSGSIFGGFSATVFLFSYTLSALFRSRLIGSIFRILFTRIAKSLDQLIPHKSNIDVASAFYFLGVKSLKYHQKLNSNIASYYSGSQ